MNYTNFDEVINYLGEVNNAIYGINPYKDISSDNKYENIKSNNEDYFDHSEAEQEREANKEIRESKNY